MRLSALRLTRYGNFDDVSLAFDTRPGRLNVICAPNGAGKSVLRTAFSDLLFGIGGKSPMGFRFNYAGMHISAELQASTGEILRVGRRKGHGNTLTDGQGAPSESVALAAMLGATDRDALERLFALDTERLRRGGNDLLVSGGMVAEALLSAGGLTNARRARRTLEEQAEKLAPARKLATRPYYIATDRFVAARKRAAETLMKPDAWERAARDIEAAEAALAGAKQTNENAQAATNRLQRLRRVRPIMADIDAAEAWLRDHPDAPDLPPALSDRFAVAQAAARAAADKLRAETARAAALQDEHDSIATDPALLAQVSAIEVLAEQAGAVQKAAGDAVRLRAALAQVDVQTTHKLRRLGIAEDEPEPSRLIPPQALETRLRTLIRAQGSHDDICRNATSRHEALTAEITARRQAVAPATEALDISALTALLGEIRAQGDPAVRAQEMAARLAAAQAALAAATATTPFWPQAQDGAALRALSLPAMPVLERSHAALVRAEADLAAQESDAAKSVRRHREAQTRLQDITGGRLVPDRAAVADARKARQALWDLVARLAFGADPQDAASLAVLNGQPLALAYERAVQAADALADRRADESALIEQAREAERQLALAQQAEQEACAALAQSTERRAAALAAWQALLPACVPRTGRLDDVREFAAARARVVERMEVVEITCHAAEALALRHAAWRHALSTLLQGMEGDLPALVAAASRLVTDSTAAEKRRAARTAALAELEQQQQAAETACADADAARTAWQKDWAAALAALGRPADESPVATEEVLRLLRDLDADLVEAAGLRTRIADIARDNAAFTARVQGLCETLRPGADAPQDTMAALTRLRHLRDAASAERKRDTQREQLGAQIGQAGRGIAALTRDDAVRQAERAAILQAVGADTAEAAEERLAQSAARAGHQSQKETAAERLRHEGDGIDPAILRADLARLSAEDVAGALASAELEARTAQEALERHAAQAALLKQTLSQREAETSYTDAIAAQNDAAAMAGRVLREALVAKLAACLLDSAMQAVERQATPAMLTSIGRWFSTLTGGAYPHVGTEQTEDGEAALVLTQAAFPHEPKRVHQLSEGTRDQLYLALRLAAIETHPAALPFIADDILQTSDDARAEAALAALLDLSQRTQVILLTHHQHIASLAQQIFGGAVHLAVLAS